MPRPAREGSAATQGSSAVGSAHLPDRGSAVAAQFPVVVGKPSEMIEVGPAEDVQRLKSSLASACWQKASPGLVHFSALAYRARPWGPPPSNGSPSHSVGERG